MFSNLSTLLNLSEAAAVVVLGLGNVWMTRRTNRLVKPVSNGFAAGVKNDLQQIKAHLAVQDTHLVAQDAQAQARDIALREISKTLARHETMLTAAAFATPPTYDKD